MTEKALITGITGQDGSYLTEFLLAKGYEVHGIIRRASTFNTRRLDHIYAQIQGVSEATLRLQAFAMILQVDCLEGDFNARW